MVTLTGRGSHPRYNAILSSIFTLLLAGLFLGPHSCQLVTPALWFMPRNRDPIPTINYSSTVFIGAISQSQQTTPPFTCRYHLPPPKKHFFAASGNAGAQSDGCNPFIESWMRIHVKGDTNTWFVPVIIAWNTGGSGISLMDTQKNRTLV